MKKTVLSLALALGLAMPALAASQVEIELQGNFEGSAKSPSGEVMPLAAQIVALGSGKHVAKILVGDAKVEIEGRSRGKIEDGIIDYSGTIDLGNDLGGEYAITATVQNKVFSGEAKSAEGVHTFSLNRVQKPSPTLGQAPPEGAVVLMDGTSMDAWVVKPLWQLIGDGAMGMRRGSITTKEEFGSAHYHVEFKTPLMPREEPGSQGRGNSGVYVMGRYEVQVLDSFTDEVKDNRCGGIYQKAVPRVNASLPPEEWQTYDITMRAPEFDASGNKTKDAVITVVHNGITIHDNVVLPSATPGGVSGEETAKGVLMLQDHGDDVNYRNVWVNPLD
ncbi:MAG: DUF1080 domain-containing protein [Candidatus Hydrogenedentes bacterium]|nr:DUF1080 domain-containing protein [Candidatus Hydrogenedentota bacterium]